MPFPWKLLRGTLTYYDRSKADPARGLRNAIGITIPLIVGALAGRMGPAIVIAIGALNVAFADGSDPPRVRARRMLSACVLVSLAVFFGSYCAWT